jgi:hypothetical protein
MTASASPVASKPCATAPKQPQTPCPDCGLAPRGETSQAPGAHQDLSYRAMGSETLTGDR